MKVSTIAKRAGVGIVGLGIIAASVTASVQPAEAACSLKNAKDSKAPMIVKGKNGTVKRLAPGQSASGCGWIYATTFNGYKGQKIGTTMRFAFDGQRFYKLGIADNLGSYLITKA